MSEWLFGLVLVYPRAFIFFGQAMLSLAATMTVLGLRFGRLSDKLERLATRASVVTPDVLTGLPWWLRLFIPETISGWIGVGLLVAVGICTALVGRWAKKFHG